MAVVIETTVGDITVDLFTEQRPQTSKNFLKLCKIKYYNFCLFHSIQANFIAQTGDPSGSGTGGESIFGVVFGSDKKYYEAERVPRIKHDKSGLLSMVNCGNSMLGSQFFLTLGSDLPSLDEHCVFAEVTEGLDILVKLNDAICDHQHRPYQDIRITHTVVLEDPFEDLPGLLIPDASPDINSLELPSSGRIGADEKINDEEGLTEGQLEELKADREAKARATILEIVGDLPDADCAPPENVLFVCKLNPVTTDEDLEIIFSRFGKVKSCEVIRDHQTGDSLQYAFVEFTDQHACEQAFLKMDNVLIDDRRIHVDFSQSVSKIRWKGKGRGVEYMDKEGHRDVSANGGRHVRKDNRDRDGKERDRDRDRRREVDDRRRRGNDRDTDDYRRRERRKEDGRRREDESYHRLEEERRRINVALEEDRRRGGEDDRRRPVVEDDRRRDDERRRAGGEDDRRRGVVGNDDDRRRGGAGTEEERRRFEDERGEEEKKKRVREDRRREDERRYGSGRRDERRREEDRNRSGASEKKRNGESQSGRDRNREPLRDAAKSLKDSRDKGKTSQVLSQQIDRKDNDAKPTKDKVDDRKRVSKDHGDDRSRKDKVAPRPQSPRQGVLVGNSSESQTSKTLSSTPGSQKAYEPVDDSRPPDNRTEELVKTEETTHSRSAEDFDQPRREDVDRNLLGRTADHYDNHPNDSYDRRSVDHFRSDPPPDYRSVDRDDVNSHQGGSVVTSDKSKRKKRRKRKSSTSSSSSSDSSDSSSSSSSADQKKKKRSLTVAKKYYHRGKLVKVVKKKKHKSSDSESSESSDSDRRKKKSAKYKKIVKVIKKRKHLSDDSDSSSSEDSDDSTAARRRRKKNEKSFKKKRKDNVRKSKKKKARQLSNDGSSSSDDNFRSRPDDRGPY